MISVIVPVYQVKEYLRRCVDSILAQTFTDLEMILVDDGSTDGSGDLCEEYAQKDSRVKVIHKTNGGLSDARNAGLDIARGEFVMFVDGDDYIHPKMAQILMSGICEHGADIAFGGIENFTDTIPLSETTGVFSPYSVWEKMCEDPEFSVCNRLFRSELFETIRFPVGRLFEDQFVTFKLFRNAKVVYTEDKLYFYFQRYDGLSKSRVYRETYDLLDSALEIIRDIPDHQKKCKRSFRRVALSRIGLMLGNVYHHDGQYQNCNPGVICDRVRENRHLLAQGLNLWEKWQLSQIARGKGRIYLFLAKTYLDPFFAIRMKIKRIISGNAVQK